jgi:hypothetical protein
MLTLWCCLVIGTSLFGMGIPLCWLFNGRRPLTPSDYVKAPFLGMASIVLLLQNLTYLDIPIRQSTPWLWLLLALTWAFLGWRGQLAACLPRLPRLLVVAVLFVGLVQGLGLIRLGVREYVGRAWTDQFNYTSMAQFFMDEPFSTSLEDVGQRPWLIQPIRLKWDRIGQSILHGFFASSCQTDAKTLFEPTILLMPLLVTLAIFDVCRRLGLQTLPAVLTATLAALLPGLALTHLESFLSQALALPFLLYFPVILTDLAERQDCGRLAGAALILAGSISIYTEFFVLFTGLTVLVLGVSALGMERRGRLLLAAIILLAAPFALNPLFSPSILLIVRRTTAALLAEVYPWALRMEGLVRIWLGDFGAELSPKFARLAVGYTVVLTALAYFGLMRSCVICWRGRDVDSTERWRSLALRMALLSLAMIPVLVIAKDRDHPYQFYKLALTVCPILAIGLVEALRARGTSPTPLVGSILRWRGLMTAATLAIVLLFAAQATARMAYRACRPGPLPRSAAHLIRGPMLTLMKRLEMVKGESVFLGSHDVSDNPWLAYYARHNEVWLSIPKINDSGDLNALPGTNAVADVSHLPKNLFLLGSTMKGLHPPRTNLSDLAWSDGDYFLWHVKNRNWALVTQVELPNGPEEVDGKPFFWIGRDPVKVTMICGSAGTLRLKGRYRPGPSGPGTSSRRLSVRRINGEGTYVRRFTTPGGLEYVELPLTAGKNVLLIEALDEPVHLSLANGDSRCLLVGVWGLRLGFTPALDGANQGDDFVR